MLLPSALSCDSSHPPGPRLQSSLFSSPPASPLPAAAASQSTIENLFTTCRALQSMLTATTATTTTTTTTPLPPPSHPAGAPADCDGSQLPTPPLTHTALPPLKLRLRSRRADGDGTAASPSAARKRIVRKRPTAPPRGLNKRRRAVEDDMGRGDGSDDSDDGDAHSDAEMHAPEPGADVGGGEVLLVGPAEPSRPTTPKRARIAPEVLPLGLGRSDFHELQADGARRSVGGGGGGGGDLAAGSEQEEEDEQGEEEGETWSTEDDRILVELVLEKLKLSKTDWQDCARSLGKDRGSVGRRWKSLMGSGDVGLKRARRSRIHATWR